MLVLTEAGTVVPAAVDFAKVLYERLLQIWSSLPCRAACSQ